MPDVTTELRQVFRFLPSRHVHAGEPEQRVPVDVVLDLDLVNEESHLVCAPVLDGERRKERAVLLDVGLKAEAVEPVVRMGAALQGRRVQPGEGHRTVDHLGRYDPILCIRSHFSLPSLRLFSGTILDVLRGSARGKTLLLAAYAWTIARVTGGPDPAPFQRELPDAMMSPLRAVLYVLAAVLATAALYVCIQGAVFLYELYRFTQWIEEFGE